MRRSSTLKTLAGLAGVALAVSACGQSGDQATAAADTEGKIKVVTSTNVYGDIVETIGGDNVEVTSLVNGLSQDPHSYEATVQDKLAVSEAALLVENGGGYDPFLDLLADDVEMDHEFIISAVALSGLGPEEEDAEGEQHAEGEEEHEGESAEEHAEHSGGDAEDEHGHGSFNEHVWYSLSAMGAVADAIGGKLSELDSANAETYAGNAEEFKAELAELEERLAGMDSGSAGQEVAITEPVPVYLLESAGLENVTPGDYSEAIEEGSDVPVAVLNEMQLLVEGGSLAFLAYNEQTEGPQTQSIRDTASEAGVPVVNFTETIPEGEDFLSWMSSNVDSIGDALNP